MKYKHLALLFLASSFLLTSLPAQAELEDAPLPGDFQPAQPAKQSRVPAPVAPSPRQEKPRSSAAPAVAHAEAPSKKQATRHRKPLHKPRASLKKRHKTDVLKRHTTTYRQAGKHHVKEGKKARLVARKPVRTKHVKKAPATLHGKAKSNSKARTIHKKPLKTVKKKPLIHKRRK
nr:hypothetical protein [uncultured Pseudogulbenkiania sp.]